ncbi:LAME_0H04632g1_1 [Lachancea meyersii CBS 8951]|uniref:LAME_0H04632g1_1 n=1 Tax=Lachancea meyersii CBS 8951 TaxID=1266667 RepID=A0A1G4KE57_9SACH|nr:LAME_0H04632g1_1 [Lachancea meyersii CBS 8951]
MNERAFPSCVPDSEAEDHEVVIWRPDQFLAVPQESVPAEDVSNQHWIENGVHERREIATHRFRSFRKRTAIQKNPYKLDRIRHKQLLKGFGLQVESSRQIKDRDDGGNSASLGASSQDAEWTEHEGSPHNYKIGDYHDIDAEDDQPKDGLTQESLSSAEDEQDLVYRGRHISLQSGFRGILPKSMWKKALQDSREVHFNNLQQTKREGKGVAKRRLVTDLRLEPGNAALSDGLFVSDEPMDNVDDVFKTTKSDNEKHSSKHLESMSNYLEGKYGSSYTFDDLSDGAELSDDGSDPITTSTEMQPTFAQGQNLEETLTDASNSDLEVSDHKLNSFKEREDNIIDAMLSARRRRVKSLGARRLTTPRSNGSKVTQPANNHNNFKRRKTTTLKPRTSGPVRQKKSVRRPNLKPRSRINDTARREGPSDRSASIQANNADRSSNAREEARSKKSFGIENLSNFIYTASKGKPTAFDTSVEREGGRFAIVKKRKAEDHDLEKISAGCSEISPIPELPLISAIWGHKYDQSQTVEFTLSGKPFKASMYDSNFATNLKAIFGHIVERGASDLEIYSMNSLIVPLLDQLDNPGLWAIVDDFHKSFRSKANTLRNRAKPIHFYQIAACQVMLTVVRRYSSTSNILSKEIVSKILDHTVSFFKLLSKCSVLELDASLLNDSYTILSNLVESLHQGRELWNKICFSTFPSSIALIILRNFPTNETFWQIAEIEQSYTGVSEWLQFVDHAVNYCQWRVDGMLIQRFYNFFKVRKFQNFPEEKSSETNLHIFGTKDWSSSSKTAFNVFIDLINSCQLSRVQIEKITPLGQLVSLNSPALLANRINLLLVLAEHADSSYESKFEDLCYPYLDQDSEKQPKLVRIFELMLLGFCSLLQINANKNLITKARVASLIFQQIVKLRSLAVNEILVQFLSRIYSIGPLLGKSMSFVLKALYPALMFMIKNKEKAEVVPLVKFFERNLHFLDVPWLITYLHQVFSDLASEDDTLFHFYFAVTKLLATKKAITWWSVLNYNNALSASKIQYVQFCTKVVENCDEYSFLQIRHKLLQTIVDFLLEPTNYAFIRFLKALSQRDKDFKLHTSLSYQSSKLEIIRATLNAYKQVKDSSFVESLVAKLKSELLSKPLSKPLIMEVTNALNSNFVDILKNNGDFLYLKSQFNISDVETQKSIFREFLSCQKSDIERAMFLEEELLKIVTQGSSLPLFLQKIESSMGAALYSNDFGFLGHLIEANASCEVEKFTETQWFVLLTLIRFINGLLEKSHCQVSRTDFSGLYQLHSFICRVFRRPLKASFKVATEGHFYQEVSLFLTRNLVISSGFLEHGKLVAMCKTFSSIAASTAKRSTTNALAYPIERLLKLYGPSIHSSFHEKVDNCKLNAVIESSLARLDRLLQ